MLYRHVFDKISTEFRGIFCVFLNFAATYELRHLHFTNWRLKICIWQLYFSGWSPRGDLKIFLISSPAAPILLNVVKDNYTLKEDGLHVFQSHSKMSKNKLPDLAKKASVC